MKISAPIYTQTGTVGSVDLLGGTAVTKDPSTGLVTQCVSGMPSGLLTADAKVGMPCNFYIPGSFGAALLGATAVTSLTVPLKVTTAGILIPCDTNNDFFVAIAKQTCANSGSLYEIQVMFGYYGA